MTNPIDQNSSNSVPPVNQKGRRKIKNLWLAPKSQFRTAILIFILGFSFISVLFGVMLYRLDEMITALVALAQDPAQAASATANTSVVLWSTYGFLLLSLLCSALFLALTITHRYLGPIVPIQRQVKRLLNGEYEGAVSLRKGDQFQELADDINQLTERLKALRQGKSVN